RYRWQRHRANSPSSRAARGSYCENRPAAAVRRWRRIAPSSPRDQRSGSGRNNRAGFASARSAQARLPANFPVQQPGLPGWLAHLLSLARFHAYVVFALASLCGVVFRARLLLIPTLLATVRLLSLDRKSTRLNSSHVAISYAVFCLKKKNIVMVFMTF